MNLLTRRRFLNSSLAGSAGIALGSLLNVPGFLRSALADTNAYTYNGNKILFLFLRGGNDGINTLIPHGDTAYNTSNRPSLYIPPAAGGLSTGGVIPAGIAAGQGLDLGNGFASLHPAMAELAPLYNAGELALIHRVGYPNQSRSHFDSERYWETGVPQDDKLSQGILYRALVETGLHQSQLLPAVTMQDTMPLILRGEVPMANISDPGRYDLLGVYAQARQKHMQAIGRMHGLPHHKLGLVGRVVAQAFVFGGLRAGDGCVEHVFQHFALCIVQHRRAQALAARQQAGPDRLLAQQLGVGQLLQGQQVGLLAGCMQADSIDAGHRGRALGRGGGALAAAATAAAG